METVREQMARIHAATEPAERQGLMEEESRMNQMQLQQQMMGQQMGMMQAQEAEAPVPVAINEDHESHH